MYEQVVLSDSDLHRLQDALVYLCTAQSPSARAIECDGKVPQTVLDGKFPP